MHWSDFHSSARQREFVKSRQFASAGWCDREAVPIFSQLGVPAIVPRLPERGAGTCGGRTAPRPCQGALRAQLGRRDTCPCSCTPQWPWCPHLQLPTPRRRPCAGAGGGSPQMRGLGRSPRWWHLGSSGAVPGLAGDGEAPAPPAGGGHPSAGGDAGGASLPTGYRGSQDIELRWDVHFVHGERWEKLRLRSCSHRDPLAGVGTAGAELPRPQGLFGVALEVQPCPGERLLHGRALPVAGTAPPARCSPLVPTFHPRVPQ